MSDEFDKIADDLATVEKFQYKPSQDVPGLFEDLFPYDGIEPEPQVAQKDVEWLMHRDELRRIKTVSRSLEMDIDRLVPTSHVMQFCDDVEMSGLYEAVLMLPEGTEKCRSNVMEAILVDIRLSKLERKDIRTLKDFGVILPTKPTDLRPESIWTLQKHLIVEKQFDKSAEQIFNSVLPFSAPQGVPRPFTSQDFIEIAKTSTVWNAVHKAPIKYREALCQRLIVYYNIPAPVSPEPKTLRTKPTSTPKRKDKVLVIDKAGNAWTWDCGWFRVGENGSRLDNKPVLGHATFKRRIVPASPEDFAKSSFRYTRPWGQWRRGSGAVYHDVYKMNGELILTDGMHAVVLFSDGVKREVVMDNLQSIAERTTRRAAVDKVKTKSSKPTKKELTLEELMKML